MRKSDKVVCIDNGKIGKLEINNLYTISNIDKFTLSILEIENSHFKHCRFILLSEYRKLKLKKLNESNL